MVKESRLYWIEAAWLFQCFKHPILYHASYYMYVGEAPQPQGKASIRFPKKRDLLVQPTTQIVSG
jgi:hypothetical protein